MSTTIEIIGAALRTAHEWEDAAQTMRRFDPEDPRARVLSQCARDIREATEEARPRWIRLTVLQRWSGWSAQVLRRRCRDEWEPRGEARKTTGGWEVAWTAAAGVRPKRRDEGESYLDTIYPAAS